MTDISAGMKTESMEMRGHSPGVVLRSLVIGLIAFLTVVDLFATQAVLPSLTRYYNVTPAAMGFAVNASTMGMAVAGLVVGLFSQPSTGGWVSSSVWRCSRCRRPCWPSHLISPYSPSCG